MTHVTDYLFDNGITDKLRTVQQIGELLQALNMQEWQAYEHRDLHHIGCFVETTIKEAIEAVEEVGDIQREEFMEISSRAPLTPEEEAKRVAVDQEIAVELAKSIERIVPGASEKIREMIKQTDKAGETETEE